MSSIASLVDCCAVVARGRIGGFRGLLRETRNAIVECFAPASDERVSVLPFPVLASEQITPTPRLFALASSKKASTLSFHGSVDGH